MNVLRGFNRFFVVAWVLWVLVGVGFMMNWVTNQKILGGRIPAPAPR
jgi:hypothetical protein